MAKDRLSMNKVKEILRLKYSLKLSHRQISQSLGVSPGSVGFVHQRAKAQGISWERAEGLSEEELQELIYGSRHFGHHQRPTPDMGKIHEVVKQRQGVTLELLHLEYLEKEPTGYSYSWFCATYRDWLKKQKPTMRQTHQAGEKSFVDYSGKKPHLIDRETGEVHEVELFVGVLGASSYTYAEATRTQTVRDFISSQIRMFEYFGGVTRFLVPDQLKSGVTRAYCYEPEIQRTYADFGKHYGTTIMPARPKRPRDKGYASHCTSFG